MDKYNFTCNNIKLPITSSTTNVKVLECTTDIMVY